MMEMGAIYKATYTDKEGVTSSIRTVPKKDNAKRRPVHNLRWINTHLPRIKFKMTIKDVKAAITRNCFMTSIDLSGCFRGLGRPEIPGIPLARMHIPIEGAALRVEPQPALQ